MDITVPSVARMYDYFLGGTDNFEVDRIAGEKIRANMPEAMDTAWANRGFLQRSVRWLAEQGIRQFIDIGAGLPTMNNTHDAAQAVIPDARILYVDNDPLVRVHANKLLEGATGTAFITADFRDPDGLFGQQTAQEAIDFTEPVGLLVVALTHFVPDEDDPWGLIQRYMVSWRPAATSRCPPRPTTGSPRGRSARSRRSTPSPPRPSTCGHARRSPGSSPGWSSSRRTTGRDARSPTPASGALRTLSPPIVMGPGGRTAV